MQYMITKDECQKQCDGKVCTTCGNPIIPFETVDNSRNPTHWPGCERCSKFNYGVPPEVYIKAAEIKKDYYNISVDDLCSIVRRLYSDAQAVERVRDDLLKANKDLNDTVDAYAIICRGHSGTLSGIYNLRKRAEKTEAALAAAQGEVDLAKKQITYLKSALIRWRKREWPGTDQAAVIERDLQVIAQEALGGKP